MIAVKVGYRFSVVNDNVVAGIELRETDTQIRFDGITLPLYVATTFEGSQRLDSIMDWYGDHPISQYKVK